MNAIDVVEGLIPPIMIFRKDMSLVFASPAAQTILKAVSPPEACRDPDETLLTPADSLGGYLSQFAGSDAKESTFLRSYSVSGKDCTYEVRLKRWKVENDIGIAVTFHDVTSFVEAEGALLESEDKFRTLANAAHDGVVLMDDHGKVIFWSHAASRIFGYKPEEAMGQELEILIFPFRYHAAFKNGFENWKPNAEGKWEGETLEVAGLHKDGHEIQIEFSLSFVKMDHIWNAVGIVRDVTERKRVEEALYRSEYKMRSMMESMSDPCFVCSDSFEVEYANPAMRQIFGDVMGQPCAAKIFKCDHDCPICHMKVIEGAFCSNQEIRHPDNGRIFKATSSPLTNSNGSVSKITVLRDITDEKEMQVRLTQSHKLEAIGQLAAGVAHEINTPAQFIGDNISFLKKNWTLVDQILRDFVKTGGDKMDEKGKKSLQFLLQEIPKAVDDAGEGISRISTIVKAMREFSHPNDVKKMVNLNQAIETTLTVARNEWKYAADLETDFDPHLPEVSCFPGDLNEVILNIIVNAGQAIATKFQSKGQKGVIYIRTSSTEGKVTIEIQDNGTGIPESIKSRVYDPFFTTKPVGQGTGQGLYLSHQIIEKKHGGRLYFESVEGEGTTFKIELPIKAP
jgi:PAS domain S-box-containing protein